jgi:hypothetical protein
MADLSDDLCQSISNPALIGKTGKRYATFGSCTIESSRPIKYVNVGMPPPKVPRNPGALMIPRHQIYGNPPLRYTDQWGKSHLNQGCRDFASKKQIPTMDNQVNFSSQRWFQRFFKIRKKIMAPSPALNARVEG